MVLHKFALRGGKTSAATGMRAAGRPPKAGRRTSFAAAAAPPGLRPAGSPPKTLPPPGAAVFGLFLWEGVRFLRLMFFRRLCTFCGRDRTDSPSPERKAIGSFLSTLAACRFWVFAVGGKKEHFPFLRRASPRDGWRYSLTAFSGSCGRKSSPKSRRAVCRAASGGRAVK